jgi:ATP-dependent Clp protease ATP-binding subunit ClpB
VHHGVKIQDQALVNAATLSHRYITDRFLPDKAIDLVDEACAMIRTEIDSLPTELDTVNRRVMQLEIEETALAKEKDAAPARRASPSSKRELQELRPRPTPCARSTSREEGDRNVRQLREARAALRHEQQQAERRYDMNKAAELKYGASPRLEKLLAEEEAHMAEGGGPLREEVTADEIARSSRAGPASR